MPLPVPALDLSPAINNSSASDPWHPLSAALSVGDALGRPATVKCRIGVDDEDSYEGAWCS